MENEGTTEKRRGRKAFAPTDAQRDQVRAWAAERREQVAMAAELGISIPTLRKAFRDELADRLGPGSLFGAALPEPTARPLPRRRPAARGAGRKRYAPDQAARSKVALLVAAGTAQAEIAAAIGVTEPTLRKAFRAELAEGAAKLRAEVLGNLLTAGRKGNVAALRALLDLFDKGKLSAIDDEFRARPAAPAAPKAEPLGKKEQAERAAAAVVTGEDEWSRLLQPVRH